ncbi:MAG: hypothetical protein V3S69_06850, partial [Dehalococcoidales bacterium]
MTGPELTEEDIMLNDKDPMDALREIRRNEGVAEDDLPERNEDVSDTDVLDQVTAPEGADELEALTPDPEDEGEVEESDDEKAAAAAAATADAAIDVANAAADKAAGKEAPAVEDEDEDEGKPAAKEAEEVEAPAPRKFRANNQEFEFTEKEMLEQFEVVFGQAMNYTQKMQKIAPYRKMISALEQEGVTQESLNLAIDALKGDKGAIKTLMENNKIDAYDLTAEGEEPVAYTPNVYGKDETSLEIEEITSRI